VESGGINSLREWGVAGLIVSGEWLCECRVAELPDFVNGERRSYNAEASD
jgi:hypothetical protein